MSDCRKLMLRELDDNGEENLNFLVTNWKNYERILMFFMWIVNKNFIES